MTVGLSYMAALHFVVNPQGIEKSNLHRFIFNLNN